MRTTLPSAGPRLLRGRLGLRSLSRAAFRRQRGVGGPPGGGGSRGGGGGGGGGGDGEGDSGPDQPLGPEEFPVGTNELGFAFLLVTVTTLFAVFLMAFLYLRRTAASWPPPGTPAAPEALWISTALMLASSAALMRAARHHRKKQRRTSSRWLLATELLGLAFLASQLHLWSDLVAAGLTASGSYGTVFYALTGLHGLHVLGGLVYMGRLHVRLRAGNVARRGRNEFDFCGWYWHYMGLIWLIVFGLLYFLSQ